MFALNPQLIDAHNFAASNENPGSDEEIIDVVGFNDSPQVPSQNRVQIRKRNSKEQLYEIEIQLKKKLVEKASIEIENEKYDLMLRKIRLYKELKGLTEEEKTHAFNFELP